MPTFRWGMSLLSETLGLLLLDSGDVEAHAEVGLLF